MPPAGTIALGKLLSPFSQQFFGSSSCSLQQTKGDLVPLTCYLGVPQDPETQIPLWERRRRVDGPKPKGNKMFQCLVLRSLAQLSWGLVTEGHHHGTTVPGPSKLLPLQSSGGVNEHVWPLSPRHRIGQTLRVLRVPSSFPSMPRPRSSHPPPAPTPLSSFGGELRVRGALWGGGGAFFCCGCYF